MKNPAKICDRLASVGVAVVCSKHSIFGNQQKSVQIFTCNFSNLGSILVPTCRNIKYFVVFSSYNLLTASLSHNFSRKYKFSHTKFIVQIES